MKTNIHNNAHCCFPYIAFSATSWCFHIFQPPLPTSKSQREYCEVQKWEKRGLFFLYVITTAPITHSAQADRTADRNWNYRIKDLACFKCSWILLISLSFEPLSNIQGDIHQTYCLLKPSVSSYRWHWFGTTWDSQREEEGMCLIWRSPCHHPSRTQRRWIECLFWIQFGYITNLILTAASWNRCYHPYSTGGKTENRSINKMHYSMAHTY